MDRTAAKNLLMPRSDGTFLVRQKDGGEFAISIKFNMDIRHIKITSAEGLYRINDKKAFKGVIEMIQFYQKNSLKEYFKEVDTTLRTPYKQPEQSNSSRGSVKSFGVARARYDFSARDRSELSLREGDTIKILSKKGHNGWWRGEVYGRTNINYINCIDDCYHLKNKYVIRVKTANYLQKRRGEPAVRMGEENEPEFRYVVERSGYIPK
ncbi:hypothetical protein F2P81_010015 [Scophthalmus maximus]|uniref:Uncharacterized protein n=1 Tax=Scophthalmus maximus TaxID=52904 RepID=A0A6A4T1N0_SCOMX|nr:hypothetical protein F2P81_010015 [Scophthalmus maximus]